MTRPNNISERSIRPNDVLGRLLNMALLNVGSDDPNLRLTAYNLLYALSITFHFDLSNQLLDAKGILAKMTHKRKTIRKSNCCFRSLLTCK